MELKIRNGDYIADGIGGERRADGAEALLERALFRLSVRRGSFPFLPELGSELYRLGHEKPSARAAAAKLYTAAALAEETALTVEDVELTERGDVGLCLANAMTGLAGAMVGQYQKTVDINSGTGIVVIGLACLIIGETVLGRRSVTRGVLAALIGSLIYRFIYAVVFYTKIVPVECLKLLTAIIVALAIAAPSIRRWAAFQRRKAAAKGKGGN